MPRIIIIDNTGNLWVGPIADDADPAAEAEKAVVPHGRTVASWRLGTVEETGRPHRTYRAAARFVDGKIVTDMPAAEEIHRGNMTRVRRDVMRDLMERAELGEVGITAKKSVVKALDVGVESAGATTPEGLKAKWPAAIERRGAVR